MAKKRKKATNQTDTLSVRLTKREFALFQEEAKKFRLPLNEYVRVILRRAKIGKRLKSDPDYGEIFEIKGKAFFPKDWFDDE